MSHNALGFESVELRLPQPAPLGLLFRKAELTAAVATHGTVPLSDDFCKSPDERECGVPGDVCGAARAAMVCRAFAAGEGCQEPPCWFATDAERYQHLSAPLRLTVAIRHGDIVAMSWPMAGVRRRATEVSDQHWFVFYRTGII